MPLSGYTGYRTKSRGGILYGYAGTCGWIGFCFIGCKIPSESVLIGISRPRRVFSKTSVLVRNFGIFFAFTST